MRAGEHGFEAGGYSGRGHSFTAGPKGLTHVRYTPPASAQPSPLKGTDMREGRGKRGGPGPQPGARRPNLDPSHCDNRCIQPGCTRALLMCGGPTVLPGETCWQRQSQDSPAARIYAPAPRAPDFARRTEHPEHHPSRVQDPGAAGSAAERPRSPIPSSASGDVHPYGPTVALGGYNQHPKCPKCAGT